MYTVLADCALSPPQPGITLPISFLVFCFFFRPLNSASPCHSFSLDAEKLSRNGINYTEHGCPVHPHHSLHRFLPIVAGRDGMGGCIWPWRFCLCGPIIERMFAWRNYRTTCCIADCTFLTTPKEGWVRLLLKLMEVRLTIFDGVHNIPAHLFPFFGSLPVAEHILHLMAFTRL